MASHIIKVIDLLNEIPHNPFRFLENSNSPEYLHVAVLLINKVLQSCGNLVLVSAVESHVESACVVVHIIAGSRRSLVHGYHSAANADLIHDHAVNIEAIVRPWMCIVNHFECDRDVHSYLLLLFMRLGFAR